MTEQSFIPVFAAFRQPQPGPANASCCQTWSVAYLLIYLSGWNRVAISLCLVLCRIYVDNQYQWRTLVTWLSSIKFLDLHIAEV